MTLPLTTKQAAADLGWHVESVRQAIRDGRLAATRWNHDFAIQPEDLKSFKATLRAVLR
jgi:excisionase family DNA binding protein